MLPRFGLKSQRKRKTFSSRFLCANFCICRYIILSLSLLLPFLLSLINVTHFILWLKYSGDKVACNLLLFFVDCFFIVASATQILMGISLLYFWSHRMGNGARAKRKQERERERKRENQKVCACGLILRAHTWQLS